jgi:hypothetical protein
MLKILPYKSTRASFVCMLFSYQGNYDFAIRMCLEVVGGLEGLAEDSVVVDFAIDSQRHGIILVQERLGAGVWVCMSKEVDTRGSSGAYQHQRC